MRLLRRRTRLLPTPRPTFLRLIRLEDRTVPAGVSIAGGMAISLVRFDTAPSGRVSGAVPIIGLPGPVTAGGPGATGREVRGHGAARLAVAEPGFHGVYVGGPN